MLFYITVRTFYKRSFLYGESEVLKWNNFLPGYKLFKEQDWTRNWCIFTLNSFWFVTRSSNQMHHHPRVSLQSMAKDWLNGPLELPIKYKYLQSLRFFLNTPIKNLSLGRTSLGNPALRVPFSYSVCPNNEVKPVPHLPLLPTQHLSVR